MGLETGTYINDLVIANPTSTDPKSQGDDHLRLIKSTLKETLNGFSGAILVTATDTGTANAHVLTPTTALVSYAAGLMLLYRPLVTSVGALTVNVSSLGAKPIKSITGVNPGAGDIVAGQPILAMYDGTNFVLLAGSAYLSKTGNQTLTGDLTVTGVVAVGGNETVAGSSSIIGNLTVGGGITAVGTITSPSLDLKANKGGETYTGTADFTGAVVNVATQTTGDSSAKAASTAHLTANYAPLVSPALTGIPTAPTAIAGTNTNQIATMAAIVQAAFAAALPAIPNNSYVQFVKIQNGIAFYGTATPDFLTQAQGII